MCFVFYGTLSKNDHAVPTCWPDQTKPQNPVLFHMEPARTVNWATRVSCGPREHPNIFQGTGQHWLIFQENKGINLILGDRNVTIRKTHPFLYTGHMHSLLSVGNRSVSILY